MSDIFFEEMEIPKPDYHLNINSLSHGAMTGRMIEQIEEVLIKEKPDYLMVYGDTNSTLAGALAAKKLHIKVLHIEAGLRSFNMKMPEEVNRILTDRIADILFCPTETAIENLKKEGYDHFDCTIINSGDVMYDAAMYYAGQSAKKSRIIDDLKLVLKIVHTSPPLKGGARGGDINNQFLEPTLNVSKFILCTIHRAENTDDLNNLKNIITALNKINTECRVVVPLHPRTKSILTKNKIQTDFTIIDPVGYFDMIELLKHCKLVITDSGGLQKEAFFFKKFCITIREQTEWVELVKNGFNFIAGTNTETIYGIYKDVMNKTADFNIPLYGKADAAALIVNSITTNYNGT